MCGRQGFQRVAVLDEFERCRVPASKFAAHIGVKKYPTFASWVQKRRKRRSDCGARSRKEPGALKVGGGDGG